MFIVGIIRNLDVPRHPVASVEHGVIGNLRQQLPIPRDTRQLLIYINIPNQLDMDVIRIIAAADPLRADVLEVVVGAYVQLCANTVLVVDLVDCLDKTLDVIQCCGRIRIVAFQPLFNSVMPLNFSTIGRSCGIRNIRIRQQREIRYHPQSDCSAARCRLFRDIVSLGRARVFDVEAHDRVSTLRRGERRNRQQCQHHAQHHER